MIVSTQDGFCFTWRTAPTLICGNGAALGRVRLGGEQGLLFSYISPLKLTVDSDSSPNYPETLEAHSKETAIFLRSVLSGFFALLVFSLGMGLLPGCVPIRQSLDRGSLLGEAPGDFNTEPGGPAPSDDDWKGQMEGVASWYGEQFNGRLTASGEVYDMYAMTAAHRTLPLGTVVRVTNEDNGKTVDVKVNDRGPFVKDRVIDLSKSACRALDMMKNGTAHVKLDVVRWPETAGR